MDKKITNIKERILYVAEIKGISKEKFIDSLNQKYANYKGISKKSTPSSDVLVEILSKYPDVNINWILTGIGDTLKNNDTNNSTSYILNEDTPSYETRDVAELKETISQLRGRIIDLLDENAKLKEQQQRKSYSNAPARSIQK